MNDLDDGNYGLVTLDLGVMLGEQALAALTLGGSMSAKATATAATAEAEALAAAKLGEQVAIHGNSKLSPRTAYLYELYTKDSTFLKYGVSQNPSTRYTKSFMADKDIFRIASGSRADISARTSASNR